MATRRLIVTVDLGDETGAAARELLAEVSTAVEYAHRLISDVSPDYSEEDL